MSAVLVTGCSSGIGRATAERLARSGWTVYASARRLESMAGLEEAGCRLLQLDVTDEGSMRAAVEEVERAEGAVGALVNNAGYSLSGAVESVALEDARREFETNVFGLARLTQLVLPGMRREGWGRIVNVSSMGGRADLSRRRLVPRLQARGRGAERCASVRGAGFGIDVVVIEPGLILDRVRGDRGRLDPGRRRALRPVQRGRRRSDRRRVRRASSAGGSAADRHGRRDDRRALSAKRPRTRYRVTPSAKLVLRCDVSCRTAAGTRSSAAPTRSRRAPGNRSASVRTSSAAGSPTTFR